MKITRVEAWPVTMRLSQPYSIAYDDVDRAENVFVLVETNGSVVGWGCAAPDPLVTGEAPEEVLRSLQDEAGPAIVNSDPLRQLFGWHAACHYRKMRVRSDAGDACGSHLNDRCADKLRM